MKNQFGMSKNKNSMLNGFLASMIISLIALGCVCDDLKDEGFNDSQEKTEKISNAEIIESEEAKDDEVPTYEVLKAMVETVFMDLDRSIKQDDFSIIHSTISEQWKKEIKPEVLKKSFQQLSEAKLDLSRIETKRPVFSQREIVEEVSIDFGKLILEGYYDVPDALYTFKLKYVFEEGQWKLNGIKVYYKE